MNYRELPSEWPIPRGRFIRMVVVLVPLGMLGVLAAMYMSEEMPVEQLGLVAVLMLAIMVVMFFFIGRMAYRIEREGDLLTFMGMMSSRQMRMKDIRLIQCLSSTQGLHTANQNFNFLEFHDGEGKVRVAGLFTGFIDLANAIRAENPSLELKGL